MARCCGMPGSASTCSVNCMAAAAAAAAEDDASDDAAGKELFMFIKEARNRCRHGLCCIFPTKLNRKGLLSLAAAPSHAAAENTVQESPKPLNATCHSHTSQRPDVTQGAGAASSVTPRVAEGKNFDVGLMHLAVAELRGEKRCEG